MLERIEISTSSRECILVVEQEFSANTVSNISAN
jgi:hypothetical protein